MSPPNQASDLLSLAFRDLKSATILAEAQQPQMEAAGFHLQQAAEKALKAWLTLHQIAYPRTHDLSLLLGLLEDAGYSISPFWTLLELNPFAVQFRYELAGEGISGFQRLAHTVETLLQHVQSLIC